MWEHLNVRTIDMRLTYMDHSTMQGGFASRKYWKFVFINYYHSITLARTGYVKQWNV